MIDIERIRKDLEETKKDGYLKNIDVDKVIEDISLFKSGAEVSEYFTKLVPEKNIIIEEIKQYVTTIRDLKQVMKEESVLSELQKQENIENKDEELVKIQNEALEAIQKDDNLAKMSSKILKNFGLEDDIVKPSKKKNTNKKVITEKEIISTSELEIIKQAKKTAKKTAPKKPAKTVKTDLKAEISLSKEQYKKDNPKVVAKPTKVKKSTTTDYNKKRNNSAAQARFQTTTEMKKVDVVKVDIKEEIIIAKAEYGYKEKKPVSKVQTKEVKRVHTTSSNSTGASAKIHKNTNAPKKAKPKTTSKTVIKKTTVKAKPSATKKVVTKGGNDSTEAVKATMYKNTEKKSLLTKIISFFKSIFGA